MTRPEFDIAAFEFESEQPTWKVEFRRGSAPARSPRVPPGRPRPRPPSTRFDRLPGPCFCPEHGTEFIRWVQSTLNRVSAARLAVDGVMSAGTRSALRNFQRRKGLSMDGIAGPEVEQALRDARRDAGAVAGAGNPAPPPAAREIEFETLEFESPASMPTLRRGSRGTAVSDLQRRLAAARFSPGALDGIFGSQTSAAVRAFQGARGLGVDGVVGPLTWGALLGSAPGFPGGSTPGLPPVQPSPYPSTSVSGLRGRIVQLALQEWQRWGNGTITESDPAMRAVLEGYWRAATGNPPPAANWWEPYWSAVFISWVMRQAGAGSQFAYSSAHTTYVAAAKGNRLANNTNPFKAYRVSERAPQPGDLVCQERSGSGVTYDNVDDGNFYPSHSDVVVEAQPGRIVVIGGNVGDTVGRKTITVGASGKLSSAYYAVLQTGS
jgi:peptidoglycan hydrolase-like protein with peptidoglycan-binding domain